MRVLCACEESQAVTLAFRERGHDAFSCDIQECSGGHPEWHIQDDVIKVLGFRWDLIIGFPPCTYLTRAGSNRLFISPGVLDTDRLLLGYLARDFFLKLYNASCSKIALENPVPMKIFGLPHYDQIIHPWWFGHEYTKPTCLWLRGVPPLMATDLVVPEKSWVYTGSCSAKRRSKTFPGVARAMAAQWG